MSEQQRQISKLVASFVEHQNAFGSMSTDDRQWAIQNTRDAVDLFAKAVKNRTASVQIVFPEGTIVRRVRVDRTRPPMEVITATGRNKYVNDNVVATMPQGEGDEVDVYFIPTKRSSLVKDVSAFLAQYGLVPDPRAQAAVNEADSAFAGECPNGTQWGDNYILAFQAGDVYCYRYEEHWDRRWFLSGVPAPRK